MSDWATSAWIRQSRISLASASVLRETRLVILMGTACPPVRASMLRCRASSRDRSVGQRPCRGGLEAGNALDRVHPAIARDTSAKRRQRHMLRDLPEHQLASVHQCPRECVSRRIAIRRATLQIETRKNHEISILDQPILAFQPFNVRTAVSWFVLGDIFKCKMLTPWSVWLYDRLFISWIPRCERIRESVLGESLLAVCTEPLKGNS